MADPIDAILVRATGGPEVLEFAQVDAPAPGAGELVVSVGSAGVARNAVPVP